MIAFSKQCLNIFMNTHNWVSGVRIIDGFIGWSLHDFLILPNRLIANYAGRDGQKLRSPVRKAITSPRYKRQMLLGGHVIYLEAWLAQRAWLVESLGQSYESMVHNFGSKPSVERMRHSLNDLHSIGLSRGSRATYGCSMVLSKSEQIVMFIQTAKILYFWFHKFNLIELA